MQRLEISPEEVEELAPNGSGQRATRTSTFMSVWERQPRTAKGLTCLVGGFLIGICITFITAESGSAPAPASGSSTTKFHSSNFGGINNIAQPGGAKAHAAGLGLANDPDLFIPTDNLGHAVPSIDRENIINHRGHCVHDEHRSPYASHLYDKPKAFLEDQQARFLTKMEQVRKEWGAWSDIEDDVARPAADFTEVHYRDLPNDDLPPDSWQADAEYVGKFIPEARALIDRVTEGIYAEYGSPLKQKDGTLLSPEAKKERNEKFQVHVVEPNGGENLSPKFDKGIAWLTKPAMDGLVRKLLHSLITNDEFYVVLGGHSAAAGHGNNFMQNKVMTFNNVMEPVFDKLGMRLMSRNMGMGGVGTLHFSLAGKYIYGEADVMLWDSGMTEKGGPVDFYNKQAVLAGARMPILFTAQRFKLMEETDGGAWVGDFMVNTKSLPVTKDEVQVEELPYAVRFMNVAEKRLANNEKFNAICWEDRSDFTPDKPQSTKVGSQVGWHPGFRYHQWEGRILALVLLEGLKLAMDQWEEGIANDGFPLAEKYWHVGEIYEEVREKLRTHVNTEKEDGSARSTCEGLLPGLPRICRVAMQGYGMWTPRLMNRNFLDLVKEAPNGYKPTYSEKIEYEGFDILPIVQAIPDGHIDVHAIAIATTNPAPDLNQDWMDDDTFNNSTNTNSTDLPTRRWLRSASEAAWRKAREGVTHKQELMPISVHDKATEAENLVGETRSLEASKKEEIIPGRGWEMEGWMHTNGYCDGSSMSTCGRNPGSTCLALGHNDQHLGLSGNSLSGWLVFTVPKVKEGIILVRMEWWCQGKVTIAKDWTEVNDGKTADTTPYAQRQLKPGPDQVIPADFEMDYAINGAIKTMKREEWMSHAGEPAKNCAVWPLLNDEEMAKREDWEGEEVEVAIRVRSESKPRTAVCISHVYYA